MKQPLIDDPRLIDAKADAHSLVEELVRLGFNKTDVYIRLRRYLQCPEGQQHFNTMYSLEKIEKCNRFLEQLRGMRIKYMKLSRDLSPAIH